MTQLPSLKPGYSEGEDVGLLYNVEWELTLGKLGPRRKRVALEEWGGLGDVQVADTWIIPA